MGAETTAQKEDALNALTPTSQIIPSLLSPVLEPGAEGLYELVISDNADENTLHLKINIDSSGTPGFLFPEDHPSQEEYESALEAMLTDENGYQEALILLTVEDDNAQVRHGYAWELTRELVIVPADTEGSTDIRPGWPPLLGGADPGTVLAESLNVLHPLALKEMEGDPVITLSDGITTDEFRVQITEDGPSLDRPDFPLIMLRARTRLHNPPLDLTLRISDSEQYQWEGDTDGWVPKGGAWDINPDPEQVKELMAMTEDSGKREEPAFRPVTEEQKELVEGLFSVVSGDPEEILVTNMSALDSPATRVARVAGETLVGDPEVLKEFKGEDVTLFSVRTLDGQDAGVVVQDGKIAGEWRHEAVSEAGEQ